MKNGVYYVPEYNYFMILSDVNPTLVMDRNGIDHRAWMANVEVDKGNVGRGYLKDTDTLVYLGEL